MSRDIRSYFMGGGMKKKPNKIEDDSPPKKDHKKLKEKGAGKKKTIILDSDSDEDPVPPSPKRQKQTNTSESKKKKKGAQSSPKLVPVDVSDVFGSKPVQYQQRKTENLSPTDEKRPKIDIKIEQKSPVKERNDNHSGHNTSDFEESESKVDLPNDDGAVSPRKKTPAKKTKHAKKAHEITEAEMEKEKSPRVESGRKMAKKQHESIFKMEVDLKKPKEELCSPGGSHPPKAKRTRRSSKSEEREVKSDSHSHSDETEERELLLKKELEDSEKKKRNAMMYQRFLHREGPKHPGSKEIPEGHPDCLSGSIFIVTGVLDSMERDEATALIQRCGGKVTHTVSKKTTYMVIGKDAGPAKIEKAKRLGIKELSEDGLLDLVRTRTKDMIGDSVVNSSEDIKVKVKRELDEEAEMSPRNKVAKRLKEEKVKKPELARKLDYASQGSLPAKAEVASGAGDAPTGDNAMWVDKYKPTSTKQIIGQQGEKSNVNKLKSWLSNWDRYHGPGGKRPPRPGPWDKSNDGGFYKAALLSGPPGIGKTTSAHLVCKELGMDAIEMNASDTRSKKMLENEISEMVTSQTLSSYFIHDNKHIKDKTSRKKVLLMDEVDGMAGNEDRGGVSALIHLIKETRIPIICMCNDRAHPKIRSLVGHCYDLRFQRPRMEQIRGAMMSICFKEGWKIKPEALANLITSTNQDVRQVLHQLYMWAANKNELNTETSGKGKNSLKDVRLGPWDVVRKVFSVDERRNTTMNQQFELFFYDYNLGPLFVFENYPKVSPMAARNVKQRLNLLAQAAESLAQGDIIQRLIRKDNAWKLLPSQAVFSCVVPGALLEGHISGQIDFPAFLGKTSTKGKMERLSQEIALHTRMTTMSTKQAIKLDYLTYLRNAIVQPLVDESMQLNCEHGEGVRKALEVMHGYCLLREDLDSILELTHFPGDKDPMAAVHSKVKAAFTRAYNKDTVMTPYSVTMAVKKKRGGSSAADDMYGEEDEEEGGDDVDDNEEDNVDSDAMIKVKKATSSSRGSKGEARGGKGKGGGKGKK